MSSFTLPPVSFGSSVNPFATSFENSLMGPPSSLAGSGSSGMTGGETLMTGGMIVAALGAVNGAIGSYYAAESQKNQLKMQAQNQRFAAQMSAINARQAEFAAQQTTRAGKLAIGRYTMAAGQQKASAQASMAARGLQAGVGSTRDVVASMDLIKELDVLTMDSNIVRQAEALRMQKTNYTTQGVMAGTSANNLLATANTISPFSATFTSMLGSASSIGGTWATQMRLNELVAAQSGKRF